LYRIPFAKELFNLIPNANNDLLNENRVRAITESYKEKSNYIETVMATPSVIWDNHGNGVAKEPAYRRAVDKNVSNSQNDFTAFDDLHAESLVNKAVKRAIGKKKAKDKKDGTIEKKN
jgi:hypothetical protein